MAKIIVNNLDNLTQATGQWGFSASGFITDGGSGIPIVATAFSTPFLNDVQWRNSIVAALAAKALADHGIVVDEAVICQFVIATV